MREWIVACIGLVSAIAAGTSALATPSTKIGTAQLQSPSSADAYYGSGTTHTNSTGASGRPADVVELARALKNDPDLIYEYVRNNTEIVWTYGLTKGAMGVIVDRAGTSFDQAHLMVELLRQAGYTASYNLGTITLSGTQFQAWSGLTSAQAACQLLSSGGIPAAINSSSPTDCTTYGSTTISTIDVAHAWVSVVIGGVSYVYDPAYKDHAFTTGLNLATATGMTSGTLAGLSASSGTTSGVGWISGVASLSSNLSTWSSNLDTAIAAMTGPGVADVVGGQSINAQAIPSGGLRQLSLSYTVNVQHTLSGDIPNQYRTALGVQIAKNRPSGGPTTIANVTLYVDDIYGRRLVFDPNFDTTGATFSGSLKLIDDFGNVTTLASSGSLSDNPSYSAGAVTLTVNMPYAANSGGYMDTTVTRNLTYALPFTIVHGWGDEGRGLVDKWGARRDGMMPAAPDATCKVCWAAYKGTKGDGRRELLAAEWLAQSSRAARLNAAIGHSIFAQHYSVGVSVADTVVIQTPNGSWWITDSYDRLDVETGFSMTSTSATSADRRAAILATAAAISALKGNVSSQVADLPDNSSVATRFEWGNAPVSAEDPGGGYTRPFYLYANSTNASYAMGLSTTEYATTTSNTDYHTDSNGMAIGATETVARRQALSDAVNAYVTAGFSVAASSEAFLGPGKRAGGFTPYGTGGTYYTHAQTPQRGGAFVATKYDANGDPTEIAHVLVGPSGTVEGGGGGAQIFQAFEYDPATAADVVKGRWASRPIGAIAAASAARMAVGPASFPQGLTGQLIWRDGDVREETYGPGAHREPQEGWTTPYTNTLMISGSGLEGLGDTDVRGAEGAIAAFYALQDLYKSTPSLKRDVIGELAVAWWGHTINQNVATISVGTDVKQFIRKPSGTWLTPGPMAPFKLTQGGGPAIVPRHPSGYSNCTSQMLTYIPTRGWSYSGVTFTLTFPAGDQSQSFGDWTNQMVDTTAIQCAEQRGLRMSSWNWGVGASVSFSYARTLSGGYSTQIETIANVASNIGGTLVFTGGGFSGFTNNLTGANLRQLTATTSGSQSIQTDPIGAVTKFDITTIGTGDFAKTVLQNVYAADDGTNPSLQYVRDTLGRVMQTKDKLALAGARAPTQLFLANGLRGEAMDALGFSSIVYADLNGRPIRTIDKLGQTTTTTYDGRGRVTAMNTPDGGQVVVAYNDRNLVTQSTRNANAGSAEAGTSTSRSTTWDSTYALATASFDPKGAETDYTYTYGLLSQTTLPPAQAGATRFTASNTFYATGQPLGFGAPAGQSVSATYSGASVYDLNNTVGSISGHTIAFTLDALGDATDIKRPNGGHQLVTRDALRRPTLVVDPQGYSGPQVATRVTYDLLGRVTKAERGSYASSTFTPLETYTQTFDAVGNRIQETTPAGVTQWSYDALNRVVCTARRMNPAVYGSLPSDPCAPSAPGTNGPDRISRTNYDAAGHVVAVESGVGTTLQQVTARYGWSAATGKMTTLTDANGNTSTYEYDGFNRLKKLRYPASPRGSGTSSTTDYEQWTYDVNSNVTSLRKRDGTNINYTYDALNRVTVKDLPGTTSGDVYFTYFDGSGPVVQARFGSTSATQYWQQIYDQAGRLISDTYRTPGGGTNVTTYDMEGRISSVSAANYSTTSYNRDLAGRVYAMVFNPDTSYGSTAHNVTIANITYGPLNHRMSVTRANGVTTTYGYDAASRLSALAHAAPNPASDFVQAASYNPIGQLASQSQASGPYVWTGQPSSTSNFTHDQLNRDAAMAAASGYDANGNLVSDGVRSFTYDAENNLTGVTGGTAPVSLGYDPFGRLYQVTVNGTATYFGYFGDKLLNEFDASSQPLRNYAYDGDQPFFWHEGGSTSYDLRFLLTDRLGSVIGSAPMNGAVTPYAYGPYGEPQNWAGSRFRYTGQIALPEAQLYHYRARAYDPMMGRFLQTDPIRYGDGPNIYAYVHGDPVNGTDPTGQSDLLDVLKKLFSGNGGGGGGGGGSGDNGRTSEDGCTMGDSSCDPLPNRGTDVPWDHCYTCNPSTIAGGPPVFVAGSYTSFTVGGVDPGTLDATPASWTGLDPSTAAILGLLANDAQGGHVLADHVLVSNETLIARAPHTRSGLASKFDDAEWAAVTIATVATANAGKLAQLATKAPGSTAAFDVNNNAGTIIGHGFDSFGTSIAMTNARVVFEVGAFGNVFAYTAYPVLNTTFGAGNADIMK